MLGNRPLFATSADRPLFANTASSRQLEAAVRSNTTNTLVSGAPGSGKTTVLHMAELVLRDDGRTTVFASLAAVDDIGLAVAALASAAQDAGLLADDDASAIRSLLRLDDPFAVTQALRRLAPRDGGGWVFLVDDLPPTVGQALFGRLRDELWQLPHRWVVAVGDDSLAGVNTPPADAFWERRVQLQPLSSAEQRDLLARRIPGHRFLQAEWAALVRLGPTPRDLISAARTAIERGVEPQALADSADLRRMVAEEVAGSDALELVHALEELGPVSASDERLIELVGWHRPRIARTLTSLRRACLVETLREMETGRAGRPRVLYVLTAPESYPESIVDFALGKRRLELGARSAGIEYLSRAAGAGESRAAHVLAQYFRRQSDHVQAENWFRRALEDSGRDERCVVALDFSNLLLTRRRIDEAVDLLDIVLADGTRPLAARAAVVLGELHSEHRGDFDASRRFLEFAAETSERSVSRRAIESLAEAYERAGDVETACELLIEARRADSLTNRGRKILDRIQAGGHAP
jgi:tetratricopeptide (TPR) repeat protein